MGVLEMCYYYGYDLRRRKTTCDKGHKANLKCHSFRPDCLDYYSTQAFNKCRDLYIKKIDS